MAHLVSAVTGLLLLAIIHTSMSITVQEFFPDVKSNLTKIKWAHATNSQDQLKKALASNDVMMIEADVVMGKLKNATANATMPLIPVMAHPPLNVSDLSLADFVKQVQDNKKKGMKLDFKTIEALENGVVLLQTHGNLSVPLWLNADIIKGPGNATVEPVDAKRFLEAAAKLPQTLLSIGWTTRVESTPNQNATTGKYTSDQINMMVKALQDSKSNQSVTYSVRACYAANDVPVLKTLLDDTKANKPTLTIWSHEGDKVDADKLSQLINTVGVANVYVDVPQSLWQKLRISSSAFTVKSSVSVLLASMIVALFAVKLL